jgi:hypothetical protein
MGAVVAQPHEPSGDDAGFGTVGIVRSGQRRLSELPQHVDPFRYDGVVIRAGRAAGSDASGGERHAEEAIS